MQGTCLQRDMLAKGHACKGTCARGPPSAGHQHETGYWTAAERGNSDCQHTNPPACRRPVYMRPQAATRPPINPAMESGKKPANRRWLRRKHSASSSDRAASSGSSGLAPGSDVSDRAARGWQRQRPCSWRQQRLAASTPATWRDRRGAYSAASAWTLDGRPISAHSVVNASIK